MNQKVKVTVTSLELTKYQQQKLTEIIAMTVHSFCMSPFVKTAKKFDIKVEVEK